MTPIVTLVAVLVGGVLSWIAQSRLAERRAEFERQAEAEAANRLIETEARAAARVLQSDFSAAVSRLKSMIERGEWLTFYMLAPINWASAQVSLAKRLDPEAWSAVAEVSIQLRAIDDLMRAAVAERGPQAGASSISLSPQTNKRLEAVRRNTTEAYNLLADVAGTAPFSG